MSSSGRNYDAAFQRPRDSMRTGYVLVSEERESGSEYSSSTCCCSSCASSCSGSESSGEDDDDAYLSDCSACWARRNSQRRGRAGWGEGDEAESSGLGRRAEQQVCQNYHRHRYRRRGQGQHRQGETRQRGHSSRNNNTNNVNTSTNTNAYDTTPAYRGLTERILATTRRIHQDEESLRRFQTWMRVLDDIQRQSQAGLSPTTPAATTTTARTGQGLPAVRRASEAPSRAAAAAAAAASEEAAMRRARVSLRGARGYFMSGGRSISTNRRRRL